MKCAPDRPAVEPLFYTAREVETLTGFTRQGIAKMVAAGQFPAPRQAGDRAVRWLRAEVQKWVDGLPVGYRSTGAGQ